LLLFKTFISSLTIGAAYLRHAYLLIIGISIKLQPLRGRALSTQPPGLFLRPNSFHHLSRFSQHSSLVFGRSSFV
jgi:hypothetical protein